MRGRKAKGHGRRRPSPKTLKPVRDQLAQWVDAGGFVRLIISRGVQPVNVIGRLKVDPLREKGDEPSFSFYSLSGEFWVPLVPELCQTVRVESIGDWKNVVMDYGGGETVSVRKFDVAPKPKPDSQEIEKAKQQLGTWVSAPTPVSMVVYEPFFAWSVKGQLRRVVTDRHEFFRLTTEGNSFVTAVSLDLAESVTTKNADQGPEIWIEGPHRTIMLSEFHDEESLARLLQSSGGRPN